MMTTTVRNIGFDTGTLPQSARNEHIVRAGETLSAIAARHGTTVAVLARINGIANPDRIYVGQPIQLAGGRTSDGHYQVRPGDTLSQIARAHDTTIGALQRLNGIRNADVIRSGQVLQIDGPRGTHPASRHGRPAATGAAQAPNRPAANPGSRVDGSAPTAPAATQQTRGASLDPGADSVRAADIAQRRASGHRSGGACYAWVKDALVAAGATRHRMTGVPAKGAGPQLEANGFVNVLGHGSTIRSAYDAPPGAVLVYGAAPGATDKNIRWGHIEIRTRDGFASDYFSPRARTGRPANGLEGRSRVLIGVYIKPDAGQRTAPVATEAVTGTRGTSTTTAARPIDQNDLVARLGSVITQGEGNYESYNTGTRGVRNGRVGHSYTHPVEGSVTNRTINEILGTERLSGYDSNRLFATGKYQTTIGTLRLAKEKLGLTGDERYTPQLQERVFREVLLDKAGGGRLASFVRDGRGSVDTAQFAAAQEWASIAVPQGMRIGDGRISDGTMSYYEKPGQNSASASATRHLRELLTNISNSR